MTDLSAPLQIRNRVRLKMEGAIAHVRLARAEKMNAIDGEMFRALAETIEVLAHTDAKVIVLSGEGRAFCAGLDRATLQDMIGDRGVTGIPADLAARTHGEANLPQHVVLGWRELPVPVIAAIHGVAFGGGLQLALGADLRVAAPDTRLGLLETTWGLVPDMGAMALLPRLMRDDHIRDIVFTGRTLDGVEAAAMGLVTRIAPNPHEVAVQMAESLAQLSPSALRAAKRLANRAMGATSALLLMESKEQQALIGMSDQRQVMTRMLEATSTPRGSAP